MNLGITFVQWIPWEPAGYWQVEFENGNVLFFGYKGSLLDAWEGAL